ncbi:MAG: DinB family protein [Capsulimonas sp.]|uniref:DinB family protein n=1 Tax=Capsulimonas sp. TaxID=2494211 RepID=UPI00326798AF
METITSPAMESIDRTKSALSSSQHLLLSTFSCVPDEKLNWSPAPTARTPLQIAVHCAAANFAFATLLEGDPWPLSMDSAQAIEQMRVVPPGIDTREAVVNYLEDSTAAVVAALNKAMPETLDTMVVTAFAELPYSFWMTVPADHMAGHARQIDYLETTWGDLADHR